MIDDPLATSEHAALQVSNAQVRSARLDRHIVFIGFMGAGKSTLAALTATELGRPCYDSDDLVAERSGRPVQDYFAAGEERLFRALEKEVIAELLRGEPSVFSVGGGALEDEETRALVFEHAFVVNLAVSWQDVRAQLPVLRRTRPLLQSRTEAEIHELFLRRQRTYRLAHVRIQVPRGDPAEAVERLLSLLRR